MEFGRVDPEELANVDFNLPPDPQQTLNTLKESSGNVPFDLRIGATKWGRKEWLGNIYPAKTKESQFLQEYIKHFDVLFFNATFYQLPSRAQVLEWKDKTAANPGFKFFPVFSQNISHIRRLKNTEGQTEQFIDAVRAFGEKSGPALLQVGDNFTPKNFAELKAYVESMPANFEYFVELRNKEWFEPHWIAQVDDLFQRHQVGFAITDAGGRRDCVHLHLTTPTALIRFSATGDKHVDHKRLDDWAARIKDWKGKGSMSANFFITGSEENMTPSNIEYFKSNIND